MIDFNYLTAIVADGAANFATSDPAGDPHEGARMIATLRWAEMLAQANQLPLVSFGSALALALAIVTAGVGTAMAVRSGA